jgi:hypothetical protein
MMRRFPVPAGSTKYTPAEVVQFFGRLRDDNEDKHFIKQARKYVLDVRQFVPFASDRASRSSSPRSTGAAAATTRCC